MSWRTSVFFSSSIADMPAGCFFYQAVRMLASVSHLYSAFNDGVYEHLSNTDEYAERKAGIG